MIVCCMSISEILQPKCAPLISFDLTCYVFVTSGFGKAEIEVTIASSFVSQFLIVKIEYGLFVWVTI